MIKLSLRKLLFSICFLFLVPALVPPLTAIANEYPQQLIGKWSLQKMTVNGKQESEEDNYLRLVKEGKNLKALGPSTAATDWLWIFKALSSWQQNGK